MHYLLLEGLVVEVNLTPIGETDHTVNLGKEGMIPTHADVPAWENIGTSLACNN